MLLVVCFIPLLFFFEIATFEATALCACICTHIHMRVSTHTRIGMYVHTHVFIKKAHSYNTEVSVLPVGDPS